MYKAGPSRGGVAPKIGGGAVSGQTLNAEDDGAWNIQKAKLVQRFREESGMSQSM